MPPKKKTETPKEKGKDLFEFLDGITTNQRIEFFDELNDAEKKKYKYARYMMHRFLSMNPNYAPVVNELQKYTAIPERAHYLFLTNMLPRGKQFNKYIKGSKDEKYEGWLVELVAKHYNISMVEASQYLDILYKGDKQQLKDMCKMYGVDDKRIKQAKI